MSRIIIAAVGLMLVLFGGAFAAEKAYVRSGPVYNIEGEELLPPGGKNDQFEAGDVLTPSNGDLDDAEYHDTVTVRNTSSTVRMIEHQDYQWFESNGTIKVLSGGRLVGSESMSIDYTFADPETEQENYIAMIANQLTVGRFLVIALGAALAVAVMRMAAG